ncbi:MAG: hypothetical protein KC619_28255 [Myxococcales bacterium]|nr:hypothetical protein [Myxococcales bacterium]
MISSVLRAPSLAFALMTASPLVVAAQAPTSHETAGTELSAAQLLDPVTRQGRIEALHLSIERLELEQSRIDLAGPLATTVLGAIGLAGGLITAIVVPLVAAVTGRLIGGAFCIGTLGLACDSPDAPDWIPIVAGIGGGVALVGLVGVLLGGADLSHARRRRRPFAERLRDERRELRLLETIDVTVGDRSVALAVRGSF